MLTDEQVMRTKKNETKWHTRFQGAVSVANFSSQRKVWKSIRTGIIE